MSYFSGLAFRKGRNKPRFTIALYNVPQQVGEYTWAFILTPKQTDPPTSTRGDDPSNPTALVKFCVTREGKPRTGRGGHGNGKKEWRVEKGEVVDIETAPGLHVLVTVGKVTGSIDTIEEVLKEIPLPRARMEKGSGGNHRDEEFDDTTWLRDALQLLRDRGLVTGKSGITGKVIGWDELADTAEDFAQSMNSQDRDEVGWYGEDGTPCFDMLSGGVIAMT